MRRPANLPPLLTGVRAVGCSTRSAVLGAVGFAALILVLINVAVWTSAANRAGAGAVDPSSPRRNGLQLTSDGPLPAPPGTRYSTDTNPRPVQPATAVGQQQQVVAPPPAAAAAAAVAPPQPQVVAPPPPAAPSLWDAPPEPNAWTGETETTGQQQQQPPPSSPDVMTPPVTSPSTTTTTTTAPPLSSPIDTSSLQAFVQAGGLIPVMVVTCNRAELLRRTLTSLLSTRGVAREAVFVIQDGADVAVQSVVREFGVRLHQKKGGTGLRRGRLSDGAARIASHYGYALGYMFDQVTDAPGILVVEDDFLFAPDFYEYFHAVAPMVEQEDSLWLASAWNDNGFAGLSRDPSALLRTSYFPGLGWLLPRKLFMDELRPKWPNTHWDHWMRDARQHRNRDIIIPEMPRDYHIGVKGTFMDKSTHNKYFARIAVNMDSTFSWHSEAGKHSIAALALDVYRPALRDAVAAARPLTTVAALQSFRSGTARVCYSYGTGPIPFERNEFRHMAAFFGVWHEGVRGARDGVHVVRWLGESVVFLVNTRATRDLKGVCGSRDTVSLSSFAGASQPRELHIDNPQDPTQVLAGSIVTPMPPLSPDSSDFARAAMKTSTPVD